MSRPRLANARTSNLLLALPTTDSLRLESFPSHDPPMSATLTVSIVEEDYMPRVSNGSRAVTAYSVFPTLSPTSPTGSRAGRFGDRHGSLREHNLFLYYCRHVPPGLLLLIFRSGVPNVLVQHPEWLWKSDHIAFE